MNAIQKLKSTLGYGWAALCLFIVLATFMGLGVLPRVLANATGVKVSPWYSGGDVARTIDHGSFQTLLRRPVFDGLFKKRAEGFVQVDWVPGESQVLPGIIDEELDVDGNGMADLRVRVDTAGNVARVTPLQPWVLGSDNLIVAGSERILRVRLRNPAL